ncbi:MAG: type II toxin-antitoxin system RelB/DinJ family antitoxin [Bacilli bacterium]|jgi:DNA-damage-inducible protein J|nr:type II toxin-antitoxin system RelB/DinJ family antitoxin [Bacilli bacterium]
MEKTEIIHVRIDPRLKKESEEVLSMLGVNTSYAVNIFLQQLVYKQGFPFDVSLPSKEDKEKIEKMACAINMTGGKEPSKRTKKIIHLYINGDIDYETAVFAIKRSLSNE